MESAENVDTLLIVSQNNSVDELHSHMNTFESAMKHVQNHRTTMLYMSGMLDAVLAGFHEISCRLYVGSSIVHSASFESEILKVKLHSIFDPS